MGKSNSGTFKITAARKQRILTLVQCFSKLYYDQLGLKKLARARRREWIAANPAIAKKWLKKADSNMSLVKDHDAEEEEEEEPVDDQQAGGKEKKDPTQILNFVQEVTREAFAAATPEQKQAADKMWRAQGGVDDGEPASGEPVALVASSSNDERTKCVFLTFNCSKIY
jgi:hypothetical protein